MIVEQFCFCTSAWSSMMLSRLGLLQLSSFKR
jgi:hypothetical protein